MKRMIKKLLKPFVPQVVLTKLYQIALLNEWKSNGSPSPPPHLVKQETIKEYQKRYKFSVLIETGTYIGEMVEAQKKRFKKIYSIELAVDLFEKAKDRFKNDNNIIIVQGDSGKVLSKILLEVNESAVFWLDGHYSGGVTAKGDKECPIFEELDAIFSREKFNHVLLIDDARLFTGSGDYPTIEKLTEYIRSKNGGYQVEVKHDIIRCVIK
jgi:hypothetical protein